MEINQHQRQTKQQQQKNKKNIHTDTYRTVTAQHTFWHARTLMQKAQYFRKRKPNKRQRKAQHSCIMQFPQLQQQKTPQQRPKTATKHIPTTI